MSTNRISMYKFEYPKKTNRQIQFLHLIFSLSILTNGNEEISNGQIDLNIAGGTKSTLPFACTTRFVFIVPSKLSSALGKEIHFIVSNSWRIYFTCCREEYPVSKHVYSVHESSEYFHNLPDSIANYNHAKSE